MELTTVLSPSALKKFATCPRQYQAMYITKEVKYQQSEAAVRGERIHTALEEMLLLGWEDSKWPDPSNKEHARKFVATIDKLRDVGWIVKTELEAAVNRDGGPQEWWDKAPVNFIRSRIDVCAYHPKQDYAIIIDWKTGKKYDVDAIQLAVNAMCLQSRLGVNKYKSMFVYIDSGEVVEHSCELPPVALSEYSTVEQLHPAVKEVLELVARLELAVSDDTWPETKNKFCRWCGVDNCKYRR